MKETRVRNFALKSLICLVFFLTSSGAVAQTLEDSTCPVVSETGFSKFLMESFILSVHHKEKRESSGTENISIAEVRPVTDETLCASLNSIIQNNSTYQAIDNDPKLIKLLYRTNNFYFIF